MTLDNNNIFCYGVVAAHVVAKHFELIGVDEKLIVEAEDGSTVESYDWMMERKQDGSVSRNGLLKLKFAGCLLPRAVKIGNWRFTVRPFYPKPLVCFRCLKVGHKIERCRQVQRVCFDCGGDKFEDVEASKRTGKLTFLHHACDLKPSCPNCPAGLNGHRPNSKEHCGVFKEELKKVKFEVDCKKSVKESVVDIMAGSQSYASVLRRQTGEKKMEEELESMVKKSVLDELAVVKKLDLLEEKMSKMLRMLSLVMQKLGLSMDEVVAGGSEDNEVECIMDVSPLETGQKRQASLSPVFDQGTCMPGKPKRKRNRKKKTSKSDSIVVDEPETVVVVDDSPCELPSDDGEYWDLVEGRPNEAGRTVGSQVLDKPGSGVDEKRKLMEEQERIRKENIELLRKIEETRLAMTNIDKNICDNLSR